MWLRHPGFLEWMKVKWSSYELAGDPSFRPAKKLKMLKEDLKNWNREVFGNINIRVEQALEEVRSLDEKEGEGSLSSGEIYRRAALKVELRRLLVCEEICWRQKSRVQWFKEGDSNTKFFDRMANAHKATNQIRKVRIDGSLIEDMAGIKEGIVSFFQRLYSKDRESRPKLDGVNFKSLEQEDRSMLEESFCEGGGSGSFT